MKFGQSLPEVGNYEYVLAVSQVSVFSTISETYSDEGFNARIY